jgi:hypothetical protein
VQLTAIHFFHRRVIAAIEGSAYVKPPYRNRQRWHLLAQLL